MKDVKNLLAIYTYKDINVNIHNYIMNGEYTLSEISLSTYMKGIKYFIFYKEKVFFLT
ncbi:Uncharacterised protein [uncultured Avibacterium sp.]|uniref:Uncharacterized protein n=1 Tax=uncultured Avibacterium sp. TaxID=1936169 RepID=A0A486XHV0_9PAST|nr:Uncharacterised protein [uncultured Avibacterium sp.]